MSPPACPCRSPRRACRGNSLGDAHPFAHPDAGHLDGPCRDRHPQRAAVMVKSEVQAAVAVATGSPLAVQSVALLVLLGLGFAYFRFLGGKKPQRFRQARESKS